MHEVIGVIDLVESIGNLDSVASCELFSWRSPQADVRALPR
jgi:hypothetical protein